MKSFFVFILFSALLYAQTPILIEVIVDTDTTIMDDIERQILTHVIDIKNKKENTHYTYQIKALPFDQIFHYLNYKTIGDKKHTVLAISTITVTDERKKQFDFSVPYIPAKSVIFTSAKNKEISSTSWMAPGSVIGVQKKTTHESVLNTLLKQYPIKKETSPDYGHLMQRLLDDKIVYMLGDNVEIWNDTSLRILYTLDFQKGTDIAIMYPKGSKLKDEFDKYLKYYIHSSKFFQLIRDKYGSDVSKYFRENLR